VCAALASASLAVSALPAAAQSHHGFSGGGGGRGSAGHSGFAGRGGFAGGSGFRGGGFRGGGYGHHHFRGGFPVAFGGFGLGLALGLEADPWWFDAPYYGYYPYPAYGYVMAPPAYGYPPDEYDSYGAAPPPPPAGAYAAPPAAAGGPAAPAACGSWKWDTAKSTYNWVPC
jgi:hypothetical protein